KVGRHDNFFDLGGHSLLIISLQSRIRKLIGRDVDLSFLIQHQTISQQNANFHVSQKLSDGLVQMKAGTSERPIFIVHEVTGDVLSYADVANCFSTKYPVYGITALRLPKDQRNLESFESMASCYVKLMKSVDKHGPYRLVGWSAGGMLAWEIARQLTLNGDTVEFLGMIDTYYSEENETENVDDNTMLIGLLDGLNGGLNESTTEHLKQIKDIDNLIDETRALGILNMEASNDSIKERLSLAKSIETMSSRYVAQDFPVRAHLFCAEDGEAAKSWDTFQGNSRPETVAIGGTHWSMVRSPHANRMVDEIESILDKNQIDPGQ
ncbi:MAG: thioesterase domain-containing protein, partial [Lautropia sp.]|nr:thioesterase domain-containing protein [Lautropia sp.]